MPARGWLTTNSGATEAFATCCAACCMTKGWVRSCGGKTEDPALAPCGVDPNSQVSRTSAGTQYLIRCSDIGGGCATKHSTQRPPRGSNKPPPQKERAAPLWAPLLVFVFSPPAADRDAAEPLGRPRVGD